MPPINLSFISNIAGKLIPKNFEPKISKEIELEDLNITIKNLPNSFKGFKICHISDIHNTDLFKQRPDILISIIEKKPDIIVISGDSIQGDKIVNALKTITKLEAIVPPKNVFITTGNHEFFEEKKQKPKNRMFIQTLLKRGFSVLRNNFQKFTISDEDIYIIGLDDPHGYKNETKYFKYYLDNIIDKIPQDKVKILISHRPEKINLYAKYNIDLVFSGHTHGGQIKIPFLNRGLIAPHQGPLAKYIEGVYKIENTQEIISPGIGNEIPIPRWNNPGKIYFVTLQ